MNVLVYDGPGVSTLQRPLLAALRKLLGTRYDVIPVDAAAVRHSPWEDAAALLVMPGGRDLAFLDALQPGGIDKIARFVRGGGAYLGLCAGAYFACAAVAFEVGRTADGYEVIGDRPLRLCPAAVARGSVARGFVYGSERGAAAMPVTLGAPLLAHTGRAPTQQHTGARTIALPPALPLYVNGGPWFDLDGADPADAGATTVLATYAENGQPAIVECAPGRGRALLVGPHIEVSAEYVQSKLPHISDADECSHLAAVLERLSPSDSDRHALFATLLRRLGLQVDDPLAAVPSGAQSAATPAPTVTLDAHAEPRPSPITACFAGPEHRTRFVASFAGQQASATESVDLSDTDDSWHVWAGASNAVLAENAPTPVEDAAFRPDAGPEPKSKLVINAVTPDELASASSPSAPFSLDKYAQELAVRRAGSAQALFGMPVLYANVVTSTQTVLEKNSWISQNGCLQFSFKMSHREPASVVFIQYLFGLAVVEAIQSLPFCKTLPVCLKWPNDIYARTPEGLRKIGGILITSEFQSGAFSLIVGCGLNVSNPRPTVCLNELLALASVGAEHHLRHETVLAAILHTFGSLYALFMTDRPIPPSSFRFEIFLESFYRCWLHSNQQVQILEGGTKHDAVILGLDRLKSSFRQLKSRLQAIESAMQTAPSSVAAVGDLLVVRIDAGGSFETSGAVIPTAAALASPIRRQIAAFHHGFSDLVHRSWTPPEHVERPEDTQGAGGPDAAARDASSRKAAASLAASADSLVALAGRAVGQALALLEDDKKCKGETVPEFDKELYEAIPSHLHGEIMSEHMLMTLARCVPGFELLRYFWRTMSDPTHHEWIWARRVAGVLGRREAWKAVVVETVLAEPERCRRIWSLLDSSGVEEGTEVLRDVVRAIALDRLPDLAIGRGRRFHGVVLDMGSWWLVQLARLRQENPSDPDSNSARLRDLNTSVAVWLARAIAGETGACTEPQPALDEDQDGETDRPSAPAATLDNGDTSTETPNPFVQANASAVLALLVVALGVASPDAKPPLHIGNASTWSHTGFAPPTEWLRLAASVLPAAELDGVFAHDGGVPAWAAAAAGTAALDHGDIALGRALVAHALNAQLRLDDDTRVADDERLLKDTMTRLHDPDLPHNGAGVSKWRFDDFMGVWVASAPTPRRPVPLVSRVKCVPTPFMSPARPAWDPLTAPSTIERARRAYIERHRAQSDAIEISSSSATSGSDYASDAGKDSDAASSRSHDIAPPRRRREQPASLSIEASPSPSLSRTLPLSALSPTRRRTPVHAIDDSDGEQSAPAAHHLSESFKDEVSRQPPAIALSSELDKDGDSDMDDLLAPAPAAVAPMRKRLAASPLASSRRQPRTAIIQARRIKPFTDARGSDDGQWKRARKFSVDGEMDDLLA
nr:biotin holocarboxylase synthetase [Polyrhizophydium stewartii]